jgi:hypothetical protein
MTITAAQLKTLGNFVADEARETMARPFSCEINGKHYVAATDGHRAAVYRNGDGSESFGLTVPGSPPIAQVTPAAEGLRLLGQVGADFIDAARHIPAKWHAFLELKGVKLTASVSTGPARKRVTTKLFTDTPVAWPLVLDVKPGRGINVHYLVDAYDFIDSGRCEIWQEPNDALSPYVLTPGGPWPECDRFTVVMPCRV